MSKKVQIGGKPTARNEVAGSADEWVSTRTASITEAAKPIERMKRLTIDVTESLHRDVKRKCVDESTKIADVVRELLHDWVKKT